MALAKALLEKGEREAVLEYFTACLAFGKWDRIGSMPGRRPSIGRDADLRSESAIAVEKTGESHEMDGSPYRFIGDECARGRYKRNVEGTAESANGTIERTFTFKVAGTALTGDTDSRMLGKSTITDGKVDGDNISFTITANMQGNEMKLNYKGKVVGDQIKLSVEFPGGGQTAEFTLKRI